MKTKVHFLFFIISIFSLNYTIFAQNKMSISTGIGFPELLNVGVRYQFDHIQIGLTGGTLPKDNVTSFLVFTRIHFNELTESPNISPWYLLFGLNYLRDETDLRFNKYLYSNFRFGREINFVNNIGLDLNIGLISKIAHKVKIKKYNDYPTGGGYELPNIFPSIGLGIFFKF